MGLRTISDRDTDQTVMYDSVTMQAFGPIFDSEDHAQHFLAWTREVLGIADLRATPNEFTAVRLRNMKDEWAATCLDEDGEFTQEAEHAAWSPFA